VDRFEVSGDGRCELSGRWFGVRGRRFIRPTLTLRSAGDELRLLADLEHKPWAARDGEPWFAAFDGAVVDGKIEAAELNVAPDITVAVTGAGVGAPTPGGRRGAVKHAAPKAPRRPKASAEANARARELQDAQREQRRLRERLAEAESIRAELSGRIDALAAELEAAVAERDAAVAARDEAVAERDAAVVERDAAVEERDAAAEDRETLVAERDAAAELANRAEELASRLSARGAAEVMHRAALEGVRKPSPWVPAVIAVMIVMVAVLVVLIITRFA
jgi:hypothetical protein